MKFNAQNLKFNAQRLKFNAQLEVQCSIIEVQCSKLEVQCPKLDTQCSILEVRKFKPMSNNVFVFCLNMRPRISTTCHRSQRSMIGTRPLQFRTFMSARSSKETLCLGEPSTCSNASGSKVQESKSSRARSISETRPKDELTPENTMQRSGLQFPSPLYFPAPNRNPPTVRSLMHHLRSGWWPSTIHDAPPSRRASLPR